MKVEEKYADEILVQDIMTKEMHFVHAAISISEAAKITKLHNCGILPVGSEYRVKGFITERDIALRVVAQGKNAYETLVGDIISPEIYSCFLHNNIETAMDEMRKYRVDHLIVKNVGEKIVGMISFKNLLENIFCKKNFNCSILENLKEISA